MRRCDTQPLLQLGLRTQFVVYEPLDLVGHFFHTFISYVYNRAGEMDAYLKAGFFEGKRDTR